jgi:hypothetical protein
MQITAINFTVAWIPLVVSILIAFVPDLRKAHIAWRIAVISIGLLWSVVLARQQVLILRQARKDQMAAVTQAVQQSNQHSDAQFSQVEKDLESSKTDLDSKLADLPNLLSKTKSDLNSSISKVGTAPQKFAVLKFQTWPPGSAGTPQTISPDSEGIYTLDVAVTNTSDTATGNGDLWVILCDHCSFAVMPAGFDKPNGTDDSVRHMVFGQLNPGVSLQKVTIKFKISGGPFSYADLGFRYSCADCGKMTENIQTIRSYLSSRTTASN